MSEDNNMESVDEVPVLDVEDSVICPVCGHEQVVTVTPFVNVTADPEMRGKVLSGDIFSFTCDKCGYEGLAGFPMIYEDKETNGGFLLYLEPGCEERSVGIEGDVADQVIYRDVTKRLVTDLNSLKEKVFIFEAGLDDRVVELFKALVLKKFEAPDESQKPDELRFANIEEDGDDKFLCLASFREGKFLGAVDIPYALYQSCIIIGDPIWDVPIQDCAVIDQKWILDRMKLLVDEEGRARAAERKEGEGFSPKV